LEKVRKRWNKRSGAPTCTHAPAFYTFKSLKKSSIPKIKLSNGQCNTETPKSQLKTFSAKIASKSLHYSLSTRWSMDLDGKMFSVPLVPARWQPFLFVAIASFVKLLSIGVRMCQFFSRGQKVLRFITYVS
jgi:hypothetical protein